ncbi:hypothetical protein [Frisingicoccus sp.]|uniref:hypothetical protein n=1 Tax=Frisingicoccus sp. TaxID=1918627 RepID=UPI0015AAEF3A
MMLPEKIGFRYSNERLEYSLRRMLDDITVCCNGEEITVSSLIQDADGDYSEKNMQVFLKDVLEAYPLSRGVLTEVERDYIKTLLYVCIRAVQADLHYVLLPEDCSCEGYYVNSVTSDTFSSLMSHMQSEVWDTVNSRFAFYLKDLANKYPVSESLGYTVTTLYYLLTGKRTSFPTPYLQDEALEIECYGSCENAEAACKAAEEEFQRMLDEGFEKIHPEQLDAWNREWEELEEDEEYIQEMSEDWEREDEACSFRISDLEEPEGREHLRQEAERLGFYFANPDIFIQAFEHLKEITSPELCHINDIIPIAFKAYLQNYGLTLYSNPEAFADMFHELYKGLDIARKNQEAKK